MAKKDYFKRYACIIDRLRNRPSSFAELQEYVLRKLEDEDIAIEYVVRTFERDKKDIEDLFGLTINYDRSDKTYSIDKEDLEDHSTSRMIDAFSIHQAFQNSNKISSNIILEKRKSLGTEHLSGLIHAMTNRYMVSFTHNKHWEEGFTQREVKPIAIKESQHRWYLICQDSKNGNIRNFGFDRISNLKITDTKFKAIPYNVEKEYQHAFGIETYSPAEKVLLQFTKQQGNYIKTFPLHDSQKIIQEIDDVVLVELYVHTTHDLIMELLKYSDEVKVIEPQSLINEMKSKIDRMKNLYQ